MSSHASKTEAAAPSCASPSTSTWRANSCETANGRSSDSEQQARQSPAARRPSAEPGEPAAPNSTDQGAEAMSTYAPDVEPISREMWEAREAARRDAPSARVIVAQFTANRQQRNAEGLEAPANLWGSPSGSSFQSGKAGLPAPRNASRRSRPEHAVRLWHPRPEARAAARSLAADHARAAAGPDHDRRQPPSRRAQRQVNAAFAAEVAALRERAERCPPIPLPLAGGRMFTRRAPQHVCGSPKNKCQSAATMSPSTHRMRRSWSVSACALSSWIATSRTGTSRGSPLSPAAAAAKRHTPSLCSVTRRQREARWPASGFVPA